MTVQAIISDLASNGYEPPLFMPMQSGLVCQACPSKTATVETHYFGDGHSGAYWVCTDCARSIWRGARDQGRELEWVECVIEEPASFQDAMQAVGAKLLEEDARRAR
jgi:hypothetical protein